MTQNKTKTISKAKASEIKSNDFIIGEYQYGNTAKTSKQIAIAKTDILRILEEPKKYKVYVKSGNYTGDSLFSSSFIELNKNINIFEQL